MYPGVDRGPVYPKLSSQTAPPFPRLRPGPPPHPVNANEATKVQGKALDAA